MKSINITLEATVYTELEDIELDCWFSDHISRVETALALAIPCESVFVPAVSPEGVSRKIKVHYKKP